MDNNAIYKISYGLFVVTVRLGQKDNGCITNTLQQVTSDPNRVSITVNKSNLTHDMLAYTKSFTASVISQDADFELFKHFGFQSGRDTDKFSDFTGCARSHNGELYITKGVNAYISGKVCQEIDLGTHTMFIADVTDMKLLSDTPSATYDYYQSSIKPKPEKVSKTVWRCKICGYIYEGDDLPADFICPLCKHPASDFERVDPEAKDDDALPVGKTADGKTIWRCTVCGYEYEGDDLPEDFICPLCGVPADQFEKVE